MKTELIKAEYIWKQLNEMSNTEEVLSTEALAFTEVAPPTDGWLKYCREAQLVGLEQAAEAMAMSKQAISKLEANEKNGAITIKRLRRAAEALDCELVYFVRPRQKKTFSSLIWQKLLPEALKTYRRRASLRRTQNVNPAALARIAQELFKSPAVRREKSWVRNRNS